MTMRAICLWTAGLVLAGIAVPAEPRDSLGIFGDWGAFRDGQVPRCYAIARARPSSATRQRTPYATIGTWPRRDLRGQVHFRLSRTLAQDAEIRLTIDGRRFDLTGSAANGWAKGPRSDAAIVAAMRSATGMSLRSRDRRGRVFTDRYSLDGAATAMDAATVACASR